MIIKRLKFRGKTKQGYPIWDEHEAKVLKQVNGGEWITTDDFLGATNSFRMSELGTRQEMFWYLVSVDIIDPTTIGQWTGLVDSKGVEIWEGDIILGRDSNGYNNPEHYKPTPVVFRNGMFVCDYWGWILDNRCEVIGNVHEVKP